MSSSNDSGTLVPTSLIQNYKCLLFCIIVAISNFQYGFDTTVVNAFQALQGFLRVFGVKAPSNGGEFVIQTTFQQLITSLLQVGLILASVSIGPLSVFCGRRAGFAIASVIACIGITIQILVTSKAPVYVGRLLLGISNGLYANLTILYISEVSPAHLRGVMVTTFQPFTNLGALIGALISNSLENNLSKHSYQIQLAILYIVPVWLACVVWFIPESPRWLATKGRDDEAKLTLIMLRPQNTPVDEIETELLSIQDAIQFEKQYADTNGWLEMWKGGDLRRTLLVIACSTFHSASGLNLIIGYATFFFVITKTGKPFVDSIILQSVGLASSLFALPLARRFSRRSLLLTGFGTTTVSMFSIAIVYTLAPTKVASGKALVALLCLFYAGYCSAIGPLGWVVSGEIPSNRLRSHTLGLGMSIGFIAAWLSIFTIPYFIDASDLNWGGKMAWIWGPSNLITLLFIFFFLPETRGRTLEELDHLFYSNIPARKFTDFWALESRNLQFRIFAVTWMTKITIAIEKSKEPEKEEEDDDDDEERFNSTCWM